MLYLLGGAARAGKTRIAHQFQTVTGIPFFSLDFLMMGVANGLPTLGVDPESDELLTAEQLWPIVRSIAVAMVEEGIDYLVEGVQLHPAYVSELLEEFPDAVRACFIGLACADTSAKLREIRRHGGGPDDWLRALPDQSVLEEIERLKDLSVRVRDLCRQHGLAYVEASETTLADAARVIGCFVGRDPDRLDRGSGII